MRKRQPYVRGIRVIVCTVYELIWLATGKTEAMINVKPSIGLNQATDDLFITNAVLHDALYALIRD